MRSGPVLLASASLAGIVGCNGGSATVSAMCALADMPTNTLAEMKAFQEQSGEILRPASCG